MIVAGNPSGRGIVFSVGIVNAPSIDPSWPSVLVKSYWRSDADESRIRNSRSTGGRPDYIQFDASTNRGNSGGPLINYDGELIGIVAQKSFEEEGVNWAIPADRIRLLFPYLVQPEELGDFYLGVELDLLSERPIIEAIAEKSSAAKAGMRVGDELQSVDGVPLHSGIDWLLSLWGHKQGERISIAYSRDGQASEATLELLARPSAEHPIEPEGKQAGVQYSLYKGRFDAIPDFVNQKVVKAGLVASISSQGIVEKAEVEFAIAFSGYLAFPSPGLYRVNLGSDDSSKLWLEDRLVIDNDLTHPYQKLSRWIRVGNGLVPFRVEYAETRGAKKLKFEVTRDVEGNDLVDIKYFSNSN